MPHTRREFILGTTAATFALPVRASNGTAVRDGSRHVGAADANIVITLEVVDGRLRDRVDDATKTLMHQRISDPGFAEERRRRTPYGATRVPAHHLDPDHVTIVVKDGETIEWRSAIPFVVEVDRDPDVVAVDFTPANPLGWSLPQHSVEQQGKHAVRATVIPNSGAGKQRFYKFTAWAAGLKLDPDVVCGDPPPNP